MKKRVRKPARKPTSVERLIRQVAKLERQLVFENSLLRAIPPTLDRRLCGIEGQIAGFESAVLPIRQACIEIRAEVQAQSGYLHRMVEVERKLLRGIVHLHERPCRIPTLQEQQAKAFMAKPMPVPDMWRHRMRETI